MNKSKNALKRQAEALIPTDWGNFNMVAYARRSDDHLPHLLLLHEKFDAHKQPILVRIHSECMTGDVFHSLRCDCGEQLAFAMKKAAEQGGIVIYMRQEGRGIGLINKLKAYQLQDKGLDTAQANIHLGFEADARNYDDAIYILKDLGISKVHLLTNNPLKINALEENGIEVLKREPIIIEPKAENANYLNTKKEVMGHLLNR
jgi:GTP cyclohydrolase II